MGKRYDLKLKELEERRDKRVEELKNKYESKKIVMPDKNAFRMYVKSDYSVCIDVVLDIDDYEYVRYEYHNRLQNEHIGLGDKYGTIIISVFGRQEMGVEEVLKDKYCSTMYFVKKHRILMSKDFDRSMMRPS